MLNCLLAVPRAERRAWRPCALLLLTLGLALSASLARAQDVAETEPALGPRVLASGARPLTAAPDLRAVVPQFRPATMLSSLRSGSGSNGGPPRPSRCGTEIGLGIMSGGAFGAFAGFGVGLLHGLIRQDKPLTRAFAGWAIGIPVGAVVGGAIGSRFPRSCPEPREAPTHGG